MHVNSAVALTSNCARDVITNSEGAISFAFALSQCSEGIGGFATLADRENQGVLRRRSVAMTIFTRKIDIDWNVGELLDDVFANARCVQSRAASSQHDARNIA